MRALAEEAVQDTWLAVLQGIDRFEGRASLRTWLFRILLYTCRDRLERERRVLPMTDVGGASGELDAPSVPADRFEHPRWPGHWSQPPRAWARPPHEAALDGELRRHILAAVALLPDLQRAVVTLRDVQGWTSAEVCAVLELQPVHQRVLLHRARSSVRTALEPGPRLLSRLEPFAGELVAEALREDGIDLRLGTAVVRVERAVADGEVVVHLDDGGVVLGDELLVAAGRRPATTDLGLQTVGLEAGAYVPVDDSMRVVGSEWLYAAGDVNGRVLLTQGKYQARVAADAILARARGEQPPYLAEADDAAVPQVIFTDPEVASVGLTGAAAAERGLRARVVEHDIGATAGGSLQAQGYRGRAALVIDEDAQVVVGATFVGQDVAEMVHAATIAVVGRVPVERLRHAVPSFPTMSEVWLRLLESYGQ